MLNTLKGRLAVIIAVLAISGWYMYSNYSTCVESREATAGAAAEPCSPIKLGLDLQGGMHLVLEVADPEGTMTPEAKADATDRALKIIRTRIDEFGVEEPLIQKVGDDRIIVELAGIRNEERAKEILQQTAFLEFQLVVAESGIMEALPRIDRAIVAALGEEAFQDEVVTDEAAPEQGELQELLFGGDTTATADTAAGEAGADTAGGDEAGEDAAGEAAADDTAETDAAEGELRPLTALLLRGTWPGVFSVAETDVEKVQRYLAIPSVQATLPRGIELAFGSEPVPRGAELYRNLYVLREEPFMTGETLEDATATRSTQTNETLVQFELNRVGGRTFRQLTRQHIGDLIAIVLDGEVFSAPEVQGVIGATGQIEMGQSPLSEARDLALVLRAGALPAPLEILEERTVGPSLGADSIQQGRLAMIVGTILVILIMIGYYKFSGFFSVLALINYIILVGGGLAAFDATLTLPGIAGLILSIGMAVDANVLIFERIREELDAGRTIRTAADEGFREAMSAIVDGNLTTLLTALVLFQFGTGPVRGFAVTLSIGIIASFFSAVYVTRTLYMIYLKRKSATDPISI